MSKELTAEVPPAFDAVAIMNAFDGDVEFVQRLASLIAASVPRYVDEMRAARAVGDWTGVARAAHSIRGSVGNAYAIRVDELSRVVERAARAGGPVDANLMDEFETEASRLLSEFVLWTEMLGDAPPSPDDQR